MADRPRIGVFGFGVVSPAGNDIDSFWRGLCSAKSFAERLDIDVPGLPLVGHRVAGEEWLEPFSGPERRRLDRFTLLGLAAMGQAVDQARPLFDAVDPLRRALAVGVGFGGIQSLTHQHLVLESAGWRKLSPFGVASVMASSLASHASIRFSVRGEVSTVTSACASGTQALVDGARLLAAGEADLVVAGGSEAPLAALPMASFSRMEALSKATDTPHEASRPFDVRRSGFVLGEGAAFMILARTDETALRGVSALGTVDGWAVTTDAYHITAPEPRGEGAVRCIRGALDRAGIQPAQIAHVNAHGTGTVRNDLAEAIGLADVFGQEAVPVTSAKGAIGHLMGAAGAVEAVATLLAATHCTVPPTLNCECRDPEMPIDVVTRAPRTIARGPALSCSFGFGGQNAAIVLSPDNSQVSG